MVGFFAMLGQQRHGHTVGVVAFHFVVKVAVARVAVFGVVATLEQTAVGEGSHGEAEEEGEGEG